MSCWRDYWEGYTDGGHRSQDEGFLQKEAREKLFHLDGGESLLDFGCGSADLLAYLAPAYARAVGVDFSEAMLASARRRLGEHGCLERVTLVHADDAAVWGALPEPAAFDRIIAAGVVQYFTRDQVDRFVRGASEHLAGGGRIILFDVIDPRLVWLRRVGVLGKGAEPQPSWLRIARKALRARRRARARRRRGLPPFEIGYAHHPAAVQEAALACGLDVEFVASMYYNYRYHAILTPGPRG